MYKDKVICTVRWLHKSIYLGQKLNCSYAFLFNFQKRWLILIFLYKNKKNTVMISVLQLQKFYSDTYSNNPLSCTFVLLCRLLFLHKGSLHLTVGDRCIFDISFDAWYPLHNFHYNYSSLRKNQTNSKTHELYCNYTMIGIVKYAVLFEELFIVVLEISN